MRLLLSLLFVSGLSSSSHAIAQVAGSPLPLPSSTLSEAQMVTQVREMFRQQCDRDIYSGAILAAHQGKVLVELACGEASKRYHVANNIATKFNIASVGKMFTAVAIAQLVEAGKLSYDDSLDRYVDASWLPPDVAKKVTVAQLLAHTSGLPDFIGDDRARNSSRALYRQLEDVKPLLQGKTPTFEPGSRYGYSNTGYMLLGVVIERVSGQNYYDYIRQHIYQASGMLDTDSYALDEAVENLAMGYLSGPTPHQHLRESTFEGLFKGLPFGCGYSTVHDLLKFAQALQEGKLLTPESLRLMWQDHTPQGNEKHGGYGYGFELRAGEAGRVVGHSGQFPGAAAGLDIYLDSGYVVISLSNYDRDFPMPGKIGDLIEQANAAGTQRAAAN